MVVFVVIFNCPTHLYPNKLIQIQHSWSNRCSFFHWRLPAPSTGSPSTSSGAPVEGALVTTLTQHFSLYLLNFVSEFEQRFNSFKLTAYQGLNQKAGVWLLRLFMFLIMLWLDLIPLRSAR